MRFSSLDQVLACPGSATIKRDREKEEAQYPNVKPSRDWGKMVHTWKETGTIVHPDDDKREQKLFYNRINKHKLKHTDLWPVDAHHEVPVAYNWRYGYSTIDFTKPKDWYKRFDDDWVIGTLDTTWTEEDTLVVDDLKTGKWWNKKPTESAQIVGYGLAAQSSGIEKPNIKLRVTHWPKYPAKRPPQIEEETIPVEKLYTIIPKIKDAMLSTNEFNPSVDNCRFCHGRFNCLFAVTEEEEDYGSR